MRVLGSITNRIFLASALLAMLSIGAAVYFVSARMTSETEAELQRDLTEAATLVDEQRRTQFDNVTRTARLIADLPKFKAGVEIGDRADDAADRRRLPGAGRRRSADRDRAARRAARASSAKRRRASSLRRLDRPPTGKMLPTFWAHPSGVLEVVSVPVMLGLERPEILGTLTVGYLLDDRRAAQFKALTGADIAFAMDGVGSRLDAWARIGRRP